MIGSYGSSNFSRCLHVIFQSGCTIYDATHSSRGSDFSTCSLIVIFYLLFTAATLWVCGVSVSLVKTLVTGFRVQDNPGLSHQVLNYIWEDPKAGHIHGFQGFQCRSFVFGGGTVQPTTFPNLFPA